jgi:hypothetical protein
VNPDPLFGEQRFGYLTVTIMLEFENRTVIDGAEDPLCVLSRQADLKQMIAR